MGTTSWTTIVTVYYSPTTFLARLSMGQVSEKYLKIGKVSFAFICRKISVWSVWQQRLCGDIQDHCWRGITLNYFNIFWCFFITLVVFKIVILKDHKLVFINIVSTIHLFWNITNERNTCWETLLTAYRCATLWTMVDNGSVCVLLHLETCI